MSARSQESAASAPTGDGREPMILDLPIGLDATGMRQEFDSLGTVEVPANSPH